MKKQFLFVSAVILTVGSMVFTSCKKDDVTAPVIKLNGSDETISLNSTYTDKGATATDDEDGDITASITKSGTVDANLAGEYTITYSVMDAAGNAATEVKRKVTVKNDAAAWAGNYSIASEIPVGSAPYVYSDVLTASPTKNNVLTSAKFAGYAGAPMEIKVAGTVVTFDAKTHNNIGNPPANRRFSQETNSATGATGTGAAGSKITFFFKEEIVDASGNPTGSTNYGKDVYTKQ